jgi:murein DD-endopeptidase MepM/ murein hydrolase activator NlpD
VLPFPTVSTAANTVRWSSVLLLAALAQVGVGCVHAPPAEKLSFKDAGLVDSIEPVDPVEPIVPPVAVPAPRSVATETPDVPPIDGDLVRFAADARTRRYRHAVKKGFPAESVAAWERLVLQLDAYLAQALPQTPLLELVRARVTLDTEWDYDRRRYGAPPAELAGEVELRAQRLGTRIGAARALGQRIFLKKRTPGRLAWPVERAGISSTFGTRVDPLTGDRRMHGGLDLAAEKGRVVWAAAKGYVVRAAWTAGYGLLVEVRHNGELTTRYSHLSALLCQPGDEVAPGRPVGLVGNTGRSTGPHLHFEVWESGLARDPLKWLGDDFASSARPGDASN